MAQDKIYSDKEVIGIISPVVGVPGVDIDDYVIVARGFCPKCGNRDGFTIVDSAADFSEVIELVTGGLNARFLDEHGEPET